MVSEFSKLPLSDLQQTRLVLNAALYEPIDLQSECPSMNAATFYKHCGYIIYILKMSVKILHPIILDCKFPTCWNWVGLFYNFFGNYGILINISLARVIRKLTIMQCMSHPIHTCRTSFSHIPLHTSFPGPLFPICSGTGVKSSLMARKYTYFRKNRVQIRKSRTSCFMIKSPSSESLRVWHSSSLTKL